MGLLVEGLPKGAATLFANVRTVTLSPFETCFWADESAWRGCVGRGGGHDGLVLPRLDTSEAKPRATQGLFCEEERRVALPLPHAELCACALFSVPRGGTPSQEEVRATREALLPALRRGLRMVTRDVERLGKTQPPYYWSPSSEFKRACTDFVEDFIIPELLMLLPATPNDDEIGGGGAHERGGDGDGSKVAVGSESHHDQAQCRPSTRLLQLDAWQALKDRQVA